MTTRGTCHCAAAPPSSREASHFRGVFQVRLLPRDFEKSIRHACHFQVKEFYLDSLAAQNSTFAIHSFGVGWSGPPGSSCVMLLLLCARPLRRVGAEKRAGMSIRVMSWNSGSSWPTDGRATRTWNQERGISRKQERASKISQLREHKPPQQQQLQHHICVCALCALSGRPMLQ